MTVATAVILGTVLLTSVLSGILGMGGGLILMGVMAAYLPVSLTMVLHGSTQLVANGSRALINRDSIRWRIVGHYALGAAICIAPLPFLTLVPEKWLVYLLLGCIPYLRFVLPAFRRLRISRRRDAIFCGFVVTLWHMIAGVSGPVLDVFYLNREGTDLDKRAVVATKAVTQSLGHAVKLAYFSSISLESAVDAAVAPLVGACALLAFGGTWLGARLLDRISEARFQTASQALVLAIGGAYLAQGFRLLLG